MSTKSSSGKEKFVDLDTEDFEKYDDDTGAPLSYEIVKTGDELENYIEDIADTVRVGLDQSIAILTPWFFNNMPRIYYQTTPRPEKVRHLSAIITGHVFETKQTVELWDRDRSKVTFIGPGGDPKILLDMAKELQAVQKMKMGAIYFSRDKLLFLSTFFCSGYSELNEGNRRNTEKLIEARKLMTEEFPDDGAKIDTYLKVIDNDFVMYATASRLHLTYRMVRYLLSHEGALTLVEPLPNSPRARLTFGVKNIGAAEVMDSVINLFHTYNFNVLRAFVVNFHEGYAEPLSVMHFILEHSSGDKVEKDSIDMIKMTKALRTLGWVDTDDYAKLMAAPFDLSINATNLVRAMATWTHLMLGKENPHIFSQFKVQKVLFDNRDITTGLVELFRVKFDPMRAKDRDAKKYDSMREDLIGLMAEIIEEVDRNIFRECLNFVDHVLKTNYFISSKTGLAFRIDPEVLDTRYYEDLPFGVFFIIGRGYRCFQVRWKDISRGGMRVVMPRNAADYDSALAGLFDEVYGLSYAQQMKNKDIPEGGSKAVLVLKPGASRDQAVKGSINALLDLLVSEDESHEGRSDEQVDYYGKEDIIYLGPDENMTDDLIVWITEHAARRGYRYARAFMSSKPGDGINHKEYGVTSEGVHVFLDNILRYIGINPDKERFTVKMTGGPDGDVAGNELKILFREYGENARVVAVADGFGAAYDPDGLSWKELMRLFKESKSIMEFDPKQLSGAKDAFVIKADTNQNIRIRNELVAKKYADVFVPAGGRPYTVNDKNWKMFLDDQGKPSLRAVVEGANIFFTPGARKKLQGEGIYIIKDSSANKCGVICSSYEILACLTLTSKEFRKVKDEYVAEVLDILRVKADLEAKLLIKCHMESGGEKSLVDLSMQISKEINMVNDCIQEEIEKNRSDVETNPLLRAIIYNHCPPLLQEKYKDRIDTKLPLAHKIAILTCYISSFIVYREGLGWLSKVPTKQRYATALQYMEMDKLAHSMVQAIAGSKIANKEQIIKIIMQSGAKALTQMEASASFGEKVQSFGAGANPERTNK